ncbi:hypothetical protein PPSIR1_03658 [Plesiocystis pacifica SIR-1]|uniref:Sulfotransferase domain-containing protein n=1 Tax=Plesiocystis pacifica SIR-1 TaxID=391625 RepID=A6G5J1_9BACT|nr:sulfotransferase family protein [Plesiocystis pacifica]EDM78934.1 hypothetical protein PPSIR1_03658 [Plesiocystis pacifica SIR-1]
MLIVTGTKRSGTSMWMQILIAAGFPPFGEAFPSNWGETLRGANPAGFYESLLRQGIYWRTNPHPRTGAYFFPEQVERHVVKVFIPGLVRSDRAYIGRVVATVRAWREYVHSLERLYAMEDEARLEQKPEAPRPARIPSGLEWWSENFALVRDIAIRRYPIHVQSYDGLLADPAKVIHSTLRWIGDAEVGPQQAEAAVAVVEPKLRTQTRADEDAAKAEAETETKTPEDPASLGGVPAEFVPLFDELYATIHAGKGMAKSFILELNAANQRLLPIIQAAQAKVHAEKKRRRPDAQSTDGAGPAPRPGGSFPDEALDWT